MAELQKLLQILLPISFIMAGQQSPRVYPQGYSLTSQSRMSLLWTMESSRMAWELWFQRPCVRSTLGNSTRASWNGSYKVETKKNRVLPFFDAPYWFWRTVVPALQQCSISPTERTASHSPGSRPPLVLCERRHMRLELTDVPDTRRLLLRLVWDEHSQRFIV